MLFTIPDIATSNDFPTPKYEHNTPISFRLMDQVISDINVQTFNQLQILQRLFTANGIGTEDIKPKNISHNITTTSANAEDTEKLWMDGWREALEDRKVGKKRLTRSTSTQTFGYEMSKMYVNMTPLKKSYHTKDKRFAPGLLVPMATVGRTLFSSGLKELFISSGSILPLLKMTVQHMPTFFKPFMDIPKFISEFVANRKRAGKETESLHEKFDSTYDLARNSASAGSYEDLRHIVKSMQESNWRLFQQSSKLSSMTIMTLGQALTFSSCRDGKIPMLVIPPNLLYKKLKLYQKHLDDEYLKNETINRDAEELVIQPNEYMTMFNLNNVADCRLDDFGCVVAVKVFLKSKSANYKIYNFKSYAFQFNNLTCEVHIPSAIIIQETTSGAQHTI